MNVRYSVKLLGWIAQGQIGDREVVVISRDMARAMALYRSLETAGEPQQSVYLDKPKICPGCKQVWCGADWCK